MLARAAWAARGLARAPRRPAGVVPAAAAAAARRWASRGAPLEDLGEDAAGVASVQGPRAHHEDAHLLEDAGALGIPRLAAYGVFDGFGGAEISSMLSRVIMDEVREAMKAYEVDKEDPSGKRNAELLALSMREGFLELDRKIVDLGIEAGSTLVMMLVTPTHLVVANVGDSRLLLSSKAGTRMFKTKDHKPTNEKEFARIVRSQNGFVEYGRVNGRLAVARAFGASYFKDDPTRGPTEQAVSVEPDLFVLDRDESHDFALLASDGLWDVFSPHEVINYVLPIIKPEVSRLTQEQEDDPKFWSMFSENSSATKPSDIRDLNDLCVQLCHDSLNRGSTDNVTALLVKL